MKTIEVKSTIGKAGMGFEYLASLPADDNVQAAFESLGLLYCLQRISQLDEALGITIRDDKKLVRTGMKRGDVVYTQEMAESIAKVMAENLALPKFLTGEATELAGLTITVEPYEGGAVESKFTEEIEIIGRHESAGDLEEWAKDTIGYTGETHDENGEQYHKSLMIAVRAYKLNYLADLKGKM